MPCYHPVQGYRSKFLNKNGKRDFVHNLQNALFENGVPVSLVRPCGQCIGCRLEYSRQWAIRCMHEASLYDDNCFVTLTYNQKFIPKFGSLNYRDVTLFLKRLRKRFSDSRIRYFLAPEYGEKNLRPHYHILLFNFDFSDKKLLMKRGDNSLFTSDILSSLWTTPSKKNPESLGYTSVGSLTFESAAYCARYVLKKVRGVDSNNRYLRVSDECYVNGEFTGELIPVEPEKARMSRRPGIASSWFEKYKDDVFPRDYIVVNGKKVRPPKYYDELYKRIDNAAFDNIKSLRVDTALSFAADNTPDRLLVKEYVKERQIENLTRHLSYSY